MAYVRKMQKRGDTPNKRVINHFIAHTMAACGTGSALVMDCRSLGSAKAIYAKGVAPSRITSFGNEVPHKSVQPFSVTKGNSTDVLSLHARQRRHIRVIYLDYMTNKIDDDIIQDVSTACRLIGQRGVVLVTVSLCVRNSGQPDILRENLIQQNIRETAKDAGLDSLERNYREPGKVNGMKLVAITANNVIYTAAKNMMDNQLAVYNSDCSVRSPLSTPRARDVSLLKGITKKARFAQKDNVLVEYKRGHFWPAVVASHPIQRSAVVRWLNWKHKEKTNLVGVQKLHRLVPGQRVEMRLTDGTFSCFRAEKVSWSRLEVTIVDDSGAKHRIKITDHLGNLRV